MDLNTRFKKLVGYELNLQNPKTFNEKMQWMKLNGNLEAFSIYVDKYEVRQFVKEKVGDDYLIPLIGVYQQVDDINLLSLPNSFVMKATNGSGMNVIVPDKQSLNWDMARKKLQNWITMNYYLSSGEPCYKPLKGQIVIEEFIKDLSGDLKDYKFFCFHGEPTYVQVVSHKRVRRSAIYDLNWNKLKVRYANRLLKRPVPKPKPLDKMVQIASTLAKDFPFVRVDLYYTNDRIYFGELTFVPNSGLKPFKPVKYDRIFGDHIDLCRCEK
ncbi:ATP-grasp fold amidoligase family protein [Ammoniphilus resinae]|uniref:Glycosyltransferase n=1 Tax=Ammoniphilus resinae TaxID=861532 RepID=A0ABS4GRW0_9BACL|nr:ATP-grasp fold amidoligase family protein [Ammoniphilus resinae]MBP1933015.1 hypothetical protein [Ammoniphilus resinae]